MNWKNLWRLPALLGRALLGRDAAGESALGLYSTAVVQARRPDLYIDFAVPDSLDGRFDMVSLHVFLVLRRLRGEGPAAQPLSQALTNLMFDDMDQSLREMGVGDTGVGKRVRQMAEAFYGRVAAYDAALSGAPEALESALIRNVYRGDAPEAERVAGLADYVRRRLAVLEAQSFTDLAAGRVRFGEERI